MTLLAQNSLKVKVKNVAHSTGKINIAVYNSSNDFLSFNHAYKVESGQAVKEETMVEFTDLPTGTYAFAVFHDENDNGKMDVNGLGIPIEDFGCSNDAKGFMGPPKWKNAKFELSDKSKSLIVNL